MIVNQIEQQPARSGLAAFGPDQGLARELRVREVQGQHVLLLARPDLLGRRLQGVRARPHDRSELPGRGGVEPKGSQQQSEEGTLRHL